MSNILWGTKTKIAGLALIGALALALPTLRASASPTVATSDAQSEKLFLKLDGFKGESLDPNHSGEFNIKSVAWEVTNKVVKNGGGAGAGKVAYGDFNVKLSTSAVSTKFLEAVASGKHILTATVTAELPSGVIIKWKLSDVTLSAYSVSGSNEVANPTDQISLSFTKVSMDYIASNGLKPLGQ